jgi:hypothetical protein
MSKDNQYENIKQGIKEDIQGAGIGLFYGIGLFLLLLTIGMVFFITDSKHFHFSIITKTVAGIGLIALVGALFFNKRLSNKIINVWLVFFQIIVCLIIIAIAGGMIFVILRQVITDSF